MGKRSKHQPSSDVNDAPIEVHDTDNNIVVVLPGDHVTSHLDIILNRPDTIEASASIVGDTGTTQSGNSTRAAVRSKLGNGLRVDAHTKEVVATCAGRLIQKYSKGADGTRMMTFFVEPHRTRSILQRRYQPAMDDRIVGIVVDRIGTTDEGGGDLYRIDINAAHYGILSNLQFAGATKRNKPLFQRGQTVFCRVLNDATNLAFNADEPILLSCTNGPYDAGVPSKDWTTKENCYGELRNGGTVCRISGQLARKLLSSASASNDAKAHEQRNIILDELAKHVKKIPFEVAIGVNGYVWINSTKEEYIILIQNAIQNSNVLTAEQIRAMVKNLVYVVDKQLQQRNDN